jgi:hypothetical protein
MMTTTITTTSSLSARVPSPRMMMMPSISRSSRRDEKKVLVVRSGFFDEFMKAITPKNAEEIREEKALKRERLIASSPKGAMKSALRLLENTVIDGEELVVAYDAARKGRGSRGTIRWDFSRWKITEIVRVHFCACLRASKAF